MPISNIIDRRSNKYNVNIFAVYEDSCHDNECLDSTQFEEQDVVYVLMIKETTIDNAIQYARQKWHYQPVTLYLYDLGFDDYYNFKSIVLEDNVYKLVFPINK